MRKKLYGLIILLMITGISLTVRATPLQSPLQLAVESDTPIKILLLMDDGWGANCPGIINKFEAFGWNITFCSTTTVVEGCGLMGGDPKTMDVLVNQITNVSQYDCISILPGEDYPHLYQHSGVNSLLQSAIANEVYVSSWCKAIKIFADADIIDGKNVTGNVDYASLAMAAGATFFTLVPPITDGYVITAVRSRFYQMDTCVAIAEALGVYETDPPEVESVLFEPIGENDYEINVTLTDATDTIRAKIILNALTEIKINDNIITKYTRTLTDEDEDNVFEYTFMDLPAANYSIDIETMDAFWNEITHEGVSILDNLGTDNSGIPTIFVFSLSILSFSFIVIIINRRRKKFA